MRLTVFTLTFLLLTGLVAAAQDDSSAAVVADKGEQTLDLTLKALGGETFLNVQDITRRGRLYTFDRGELSSPGSRFVDYVKFTGMERMEMGKDGKIVYLNNNDEGWELDRQGIRDMSPEQIETFKQGNKRDYEYLLRFRARGEKMNIYYLGREFVDNRRAHILELVDPDNESTKLYVDARTYLPMQIRYRERDPLTGDWIDVVEYFGKYVKIQGIMTPKQFTRERGGHRVLEAYFLEVQYNTGLPDSLFTRAALEEHWQKVK
jgi:hypothetical protein